MASKKFGGVTESAGLALGLSALAVLICFFYARTINAGLTLDDFSHLGYAWQTVNGDIQALFNKLFGSWTSGKEDGIVAYRPTTCTTFVIDCALWQAKAYGFHLSNLFFFFLDCLFTSLVTYKLVLHCQVSKLQAAGAACLAAFFMALYPGHPDSVVTVVGRVDSLPTAFYMAAIYFYMLFREQGKRKFLWTGLVFFWLGLGSKETVVTLPVILLAGELLDLFEAPALLNKLSLKDRLVQASKHTAPFFVTLFLFAVLRQIVLHGQVGGYGKVHFKGMLRQLLGFFDKATLAKIFVPINEHFPMPAFITDGMLAVYAVAFINLVRLAVSNKSMAKLILFLIVFAITNVLLTFQIWHIYPNLVGFRLFFLSSTALCAILAIALFVDDKDKVWSIINALTAVGLAIVWGAALHNNIFPFEVAGKQMAALQKQLNQLAIDAKPGQLIILNDLPQDYCGSPMIGRAAFLRVMLQPPYNDRDVLANFAVGEGGKVIDLYTQDPLFVEMPPSSYPTYRWDKEKALFVKTAP